MDFVIMMIYLESFKFLSEYRVRQSFTSASDVKDLVEDYYENLFVMFKVSLFL